MAGGLLPQPKQLIQDNAWNPGIAYQLYTYEPASLTPKATYQDVALTIANANPVLANARGEVVMYGSGSYRIILKDSLGSTVWDRDNIDALVGVSALIGANGAALVGYDDTTLDVILKSRINRVVGSISALRALNKSKNNQAFVTGYYAAGDGGGGAYYYDSADTSSADNNGSIIVAADGGRWKLADNDFISVKQFGAKGDGSANDTAAIAAADAWARLKGIQLYFPGSVYMVSQLVVNTGAYWLGDDRSNTTIKQIIGSNTDLIYGANSNANWGAATPAGIVNGYILKNLTFDGNYNSGSGNTSGSGLVVYGSRPILENIHIKNVAEHGMRTEYTDSAAGGTDAFAMEGYLSNVRIDTVGKHGWWNNGPHDTMNYGMIVIDCSQAAANTYDAFYYDAKSTGRNDGIHAWTRAASVRMRYALNLRPGCGHEFTGGCNFEGAYVANVNIETQNCRFDQSTRYYAAWNGYNILLQGTCTRNYIGGSLEGPGSGRPACIGVVFGSGASDYIADNTIDCDMALQENGNIYFSAKDGGNNKIRVRAFNQTTASINGTPNAADDIDILINNTGGTSHINNRRQKTALNIAANAAVTWTFPYAYGVNPLVTFSPIAPSGSITSGLWVSSISTTAVSIYNNNPIALSVNIVADAMN